MIDDGWEYKIKDDYQPYMVDLMEFFHGGIDYPKNARFTREELLELGPLNIKRWLVNKAFGDPDASIEQGDQPLFARSSTMEFAKKAVSYYMPNRLPKWVNGEGNPTKSSLVTDLLVQVKKSEVRGEGVVDQSMRAVSEQEFRMTITLFRAQNDWTYMWKYSTMALWQFHLIGRIDDVVHFKVDDLKSHGRFSYALQAKVRWSKNVMEERSCPDQILMGAMDPMFCILSNLGLYLESYLGNYPNSTYLFIHHGAQTGPKNLIQTYRSKLETVVLQNPAFIACSPGANRRGVGTHSYRKFPSQYAIDKGASPDDVEIRGCWKKRGRRVVFCYIDPGQIYSDAKVESLLCVRGPVKYALRQGVEISDEWLFQNVVRNIRNCFSNDYNLCKMFGLAVLFAVMDESIDVPNGIREQVTLAYMALGIDEPHPVIKIPIYVYRIDDRLMIDEINQQDLNAGNNVGYIINQVTTGIMSHQALMVKLDRMERQINDQFRQVYSMIEASNRLTINNHNTMNANIRRFGGTIEGAFVVQRGRGRDRQHDIPVGNGNAVRHQDALLSHNPRTLLELWREYKHGLDGRKPAEQFTMAERNSRVGGVKQKWYRRNVVWQCIERLVRGGDTAQVAVNKIHQAYGYNLSITEIINLMIRDKRTGGHPNLR